MGPTAALTPRAISPSSHILNRQRPTRRHHLHFAKWDESTHLDRVTVMPTANIRHRACCQTRSKPSPMMVAEADRRAWSPDPARPSGARSLGLRRAQEIKDSLSYGKQILGLAADGCRAPKSPAPSARRSVEAGEVLVHGKPVTIRRPRRGARPHRYLSEDRKAFGLATSSRPHQPRAGDASRSSASALIARQIRQTARLSGSSASRPVHTQ